MQTAGVEVIFRFTIYLTAADCGPLRPYETSSVAISVRLIDWTQRPSPETKVENIS